LYTPHAGQWPLHNSKARFRIATCGRRWGKTLACTNELVKYAMENPGAVTWWVAPTYQQVMIAWRLLFKYFEPLIQDDNKGEKWILWVTGATTFFKSTERHDNLRGEGVNFMIIDEAADVPPDAWFASLRPTLSDTMGRAIIVGTPKGKNWFFQEWSRGQDPEYPEYESFRFPTASNPYIPPEEIEFARRTLPADLFRQEYEAEFLEDGAGVFRGIRACIDGSLEDPKPGKEYVIGLDLARYQDYTVAICMDQETGHVVAYDRFNKIDWGFQMDRVQAMAERYNDAVIWFDANSVGDPLAEEMKARGLTIEPFKITPTTKGQLIQLLAAKIQQGEISYPEIPELIAELSMFGYEILPSGHIRYSAPPGHHDDMVIALALATWGKFNQVQPRVRVVDIGGAAPEGRTPLHTQW